MSGHTGTELGVGTFPRSYRVSQSSMVPPPAILVELVERFHVCWDFWPEIILVQHERRQVGFALGLYGTHEPGLAHPKQRCSHCENVFAVLHVIADWILPRERKAAMHEVEVRSPSDRHLPARHNSSCVTFTIRVTRRRGYEVGAHDCETELLEELGQRLGELGAVKANTQASEPLEGD